MRVLWVLALLFVASSASAQDKKAPPAAPAPAPPPPVHGSALLHISAEIANGIGQVPPGALVVASSITSDIPAPKADELAVRIAAQVAGRIGVAKAHGQPAALAVARSLSGRAASLVYLQLEIAKGELRVTADLYPVVSNGWERLRNPVPGPRAHAFAMAPLDAEVRGFLTPVLLERASLHRVRHDEGEIVAIGCGDLDGDGGNELVLVGRQRLSIAKIQGGKLVVERSAKLADLASRLPVPLRDPIASVLVSPPGHRGEILLGTTDRGGVVIDASLVARRQLTGLPVPGADGDACTVASAEASAFEGNAVACEIPPPLATPPARGSRPVKNEPAVAFTLPLTRYDAVAALDAVGRDGTISQVVAAREPNGKLRIRLQVPSSTRPVEAVMEGAGAQLALVDLDLDGTPEIVTTSDGTTDDQLLVSSIARGLVTPRLRFPAREGVRAIGVCPPEEKGVPAVVAVVGNEVWVVR